MALCGGNGGLHFHFLQGQLASGLVAHQACDFTDQLPELLNGGILTAQDRQLVLNEGMVQYVYFCHDFFLLYVYFEFSRSSRSRSA